MALYDEISNCIWEVSVPTPLTVYKTSFNILNTIVELIKNDAYDDPECFRRIERIVEILNESGIDTGIRHDF